MATSMAEDDNTISLEGIEWDTKQVRLRDFSEVYQQPTLIKVTHGQFMKVGVTKSKHPENLHQELLLHSLEQNKKVLGQALKVVHPGKKPSEADLKLSIPLTYQGWFEVMSEDGKSMPPVASVKDLAKFSAGVVFLVREEVKAYEADDENKLHIDKGKIVPAGEILEIAETKVITMPFNKKKMKLLQCTTSKDEKVYLAHDQKALFSPVAGKQNISGVHTIKGIVSKFRLPVTVKAVYGPTPSALRNTKFSGILRLTVVEADETAFFMPIKRLKEKMIPISTVVPLKLQAATNSKHFLQKADFQDLHYRCSKMVSSYLGSMHILVNMPEPGRYKSFKDQSAEPTLPQVLSNPKKKQVEDIMFDEVDDLYAYVREGGEPPKPRLIQTESVDSQDWEEPIYEYLDKYQQETENGQENKTPDLPNSPPPKKFNLVQKHSVDANKHEICATPRSNGTAVALVASDRRASATDSHSSGGKKNGTKSYDDVISKTAIVQQKTKQPSVKQSDRQYVTLPQKTKIVDTSKLLVTFASHKNTNSGSKSASGSSGDKLSKDSKEGAKGSCNPGDKSQKPKKRITKAIYL